MLLTVLAIKVSAIIVAVIVVWAQIASHDIAKSLTKTLLESAGFHPTTNNLTFFKTFENVCRNEIFGGRNNELLIVTTKTEVPGIVHESSQGQCELVIPIASKCTWSDLLGFHMPMQGPSPSPGQPNGAVQFLTNLILKLRSRFNDFRLKFRPVALRIRGHIPWKQNAPVELGVVWTIAIILYAGITWYERLQHDYDHLEGNILLMNGHGRKLIQYSADLLPSTSPAD